MDNWAETQALGKRIAKILDREKIKPPISMLAWKYIHEAISAALDAASNVECGPNEHN